MIRGIKSITMTQDFIVDHFPKTPCNAWNNDNGDFCSVN